MNEEARTLLADIHLHALYGVDDGAKSYDEMLGIVKKAYDAGTRLICFTPHYHPGYYGDNREKSLSVFEELRAVKDEKFPDLELFLGNELHYEKGARHWVEDGNCRTIGGSDYVLVDFSADEDGKYIQDALYRLQNSGYTPVVAHVEKYVALFGKIDVIADFRRDGMLVQLDASSILGEEGLRVKHQSRKLLDNGIVDFIASDAHRLDKRTWRLDECYNLVLKKYGRRMANALFYDNAVSILSKKPTEEKIKNG